MADDTDDVDDLVNIYIFSIYCKEAWGHCSESISFKNNFLRIFHQMSLMVQAYCNPQYKLSNHTFSFPPPPSLFLCSWTTCKEEGNGSDCRKNAKYSSLSPSLHCSASHMETDGYLGGILRRKNMTLTWLVIFCWGSYKTQLGLDKRQDSECLWS